MTQKILIFRRGSIGDAVVSLPALIAIRKRYPEAELRILTNAPVMGRATPISSLLGRSNLIADYFSLPPGGGGLGKLRETRNAIKEWSPDKLIYLSEPSKTVSLLKEYLFFKACGIASIEAMPFAQALRQYLPKDYNLWEFESTRLLRAIQLSAPDEINLTFSEDEISTTAALIKEGFNTSPFIAFCIGGKLPDKDWGDRNWQIVLAAITAEHPNMGLLLIGAEDESARSNTLANTWQGPVLNLCGKTNPRDSALAMKKAVFYLGHDTGPMHLAALTNVPCIALFSARSKPGVWFPFGDNHSIFYPWDQVDKVNNKAGFRTAGATILTIESADVIKCCLEYLTKSPKL
jgi:heptosyltransferase III